MKRSSRVLYFSVLWLLASYCGADTRRHLPALFEDFEGPARLAVRPLSSTASGSAQLRATLLLPAAELGDEGRLLTRLALRSDGAATSPARSLRGSITIEHSSAAWVDEQFDANRGLDPIVFFVSAELGQDPETGYGYYSFELPGGFHWDPQRADQLLLHLELRADSEFVLDLAPEVDPEFVFAESLASQVGHRPAGRPVLCVWTRQWVPDQRPPSDLDDWDRLEAPEVMLSRLSWRIEQLESELSRLRATAAAQAAGGQPLLPAEGPRVLTSVPELPPAGEPGASGWQVTPVTQPLARPPRAWVPRPRGPHELSATAPMRAPGQSRAAAPAQQPPASGGD